MFSHQLLWLAHRQSHRLQAPFWFHSCSLLSVPTFYFYEMRTKIVFCFLFLSLSSLLYLSHQPQNMETETWKKKNQTGIAIHTKAKITRTNFIGSIYLTNLACSYVHNAFANSFNNKNKQDQNNEIYIISFLNPIISQLNCTTSIKLVSSMCMGWFSALQFTELQEQTLRSFHPKCNTISERAGKLEIHPREFNYSCDL